MDIAPALPEIQEESSSDDAPVVILEEEQPPPQTQYSQFYPPKQRDYKISYQLGSVCGEGTFGKVYNAIERSTGISLAVKELKSESMTDAQLAEVQTEIQFMTNLKHKNIVKIYD